MKYCPYRVHGERRASLTVQGEYYYNECFMPCLKEECACYVKDGEEEKCLRSKRARRGDE